MRWVSFIQLKDTISRIVSELLSSRVQKNTQANRYLNILKKTMI